MAALKCDIGAQAVVCCATLDEDATGNFGRIYRSPEPFRARSSPVAVVDAAAIVVVTDWAALLSSQVSV